MTLENARNLRRGMTDAKRKLWQHLRGGRLYGLKFRRQYPIPPYAVDFYCEALKLVVELDGSQHSSTGDAERTRYLQSQGMRVLRFWNNDVLLYTDAVVESILGVAGVLDPVFIRTLTPTPLPMGEGLSESESTP
jgi:very-short-patch-repair endonuclease